MGVEGARGEEGGRTGPHWLFEGAWRDSVPCCPAMLSFQDSGSNTCSGGGWRKGECHKSWAGAARDARDASATVVGSTKVWASVGDSEQSIKGG